MKAALRRLSLGLAVLPLSILPATANDFTGAYGGILLGHQTGSAQSGDFDLTVTGGFVGLEIGATYQLDNGVVIGIAADIDNSRASGEVKDGDHMMFSGEADGNVTVRGILGYEIAGVLPYLTAGFAYTQSTATMHCPDNAPFGKCSYFGGFTASVPNNRTGYVVGTGIEVPVAEHVSLKAEYLYTDFGSDSLTIEPPKDGPQTSPVPMTSSTLRSGLLFRF
jgi:outer membrane immunogenic protein